MNERDRQVADAAVRRVVLEDDLALVEIVNACEDFDQRRFSGAIFTEKSEHLSFAEIES